MIEIAARAQKENTVALIGNPNVGKSVIFGVLTGKYVTVSNYPGTTVEVTRGTGRVDGNLATIIDTPGTNSFIPMSEDERVTRDILLNEKVEAVIQVGDAKNLKRILQLSLQLSEMQIPFLLNLNMMDEAANAGVNIDVDKLSELLGVGVNPSIAIRREGTDRLQHIFKEAKIGEINIRYPEAIELAIEKIEAILPVAPVSKRAFALMLLTNDNTLRPWVTASLSVSEIDELNEIIWDVEEKLSAPVNFVITQSRFKAIDKIFLQVVSNRKSRTHAMLSWLERHTTHPIWGVPFLLVVLFIVYEFVGVFGAGMAVDFFENTIFGQYINPAAIWLFSFIPIHWLQELFVGEYGVITMALAYGFAIVLPIVTTFFIVFSILEDSGYLPRLALLVNNMFKMIGLNGKAVLPMILGLGCDTMATMSARIMETRKERVIVTMLLALGVPCSAQLGVILGMTALLPWEATVIWFGMVTLVMMLVGYLSSKILPGTTSDFILELPPIRFPVISNILVKTLARIEWYLKEVVPIFVLGTLLLYILDKTQAMSVIEKVSAPVVQKFLGLPAKTTEAFLIGFLRRDYGAAGLFNLANQGLLTANQIVISVITITLFVPCIANLLMIIKELGIKTAVAMSLFIVPFAFVIGGIVNYAFKMLGVNL